MTGARPPSAPRIVAIAVVAFIAAVAVHALLGALGVASDDPFRLFVTPFVGATIVYAGLSGYHRWGRVRLSVMVGLLLLLFSGAM